MRRLLMFCAMIPGFVAAQNQSARFASIDRRVRDADAPTVDSLSRLLTKDYSTELEKTRAIFSWVAQHISYNTGIFTRNKSYRVARFTEDPDDTISSKPAIVQTAERVLRRRVAVCDGYAKLFKTLCDYAGLQSELVVGYGNTYRGRNDPFRTNHTWNAVRIDSNWYLVDVTWASGFVSFTNEFVPHLDDSYFLTPPQQFILDHYPEELKWTLMDDPPTLKAFRHSPFRYKSFVKYGILSESPGNGTIEAAPGDTVQIILRLRSAAKDSTIAPDAFFDSTVMTESPRSVFLDPVIKNNTAVYHFVIGAEAVEWLHIVYNGDPILRYKLYIRRQQPTE